VTDMIVDRFPAVLVQLHQTALRVLKVHIRGDTGSPRRQDRHCKGAAFPLLDSPERGSGAGSVCQRNR